MNTMNDPFYIGLFHNSKEKKTLLLEIDQEIFNMMLAKSMHQIARIEFRNSKISLRKGALPPCNPRQGALPPGPPPGGQPPGTPLID